MHEWGYVVLVVGLGRLAAHTGGLGDVAHHFLEGLVLLRAHLLNNVGEHLVELFGFVWTSHDEKVFPHGELDCTNCYTAQVAYCLAS